MRPFYLWFTAVTVFLVASVTPIPFSIPVPWAGVVLAALVLSVSALPFAYGRVYLTSANLGMMSREASTDGDGDGSEAIDVSSDLAGGMASGFRLEEDLFGREAYPLLGQPDGIGAGPGGPGVAELLPGSLTWKQCLRVSFAAK